jgi:hypothetical protein
MNAVATWHGRFEGRLPQAGKARGRHHRFLPWRER